MRVELERISKRYGDRFVVSDATLSVRSGELIALLGPSGCGKSTLLTLLAGLVAPDAGIVRLDDRVANDPRIRVPPSQRSIGMVFQDLALWPHMTVEHHLRFVAPKTDPRPILEALEIAHLASARPATLSGGEAQRLAIARALATRPSILLLDEPLGPLDQRLKAKMLDLISDLHRRFGTTTLHVTHDYEEAFRLADRVAIMSKGRIMQTGTPDEIYRRPAGVEAAELSGPVSFLPGTGGMDGTVSTSLGRLRTYPDAPTRGDGLLVVVRPDRVAVQPAESGCFVESAFNTGTRWELRIRTRDGILSVLTPTRIEPGTQVSVSLSEPVWTVLK